MGVLKSVLGNSGLRISSLTKVSLIPALHLLPPSTPFWPHGTDPFFPHAQTMSILSDLLYSLTRFLFKLSFAPFVTLQSNFSKTSSQEHSLSYSQHFSCPIPLLFTMPLVQLLLHVGTSRFIPSPLLLSTLFSAPHVLHSSFNASLLHPPSPRPQVFKTIHFI